MKNLDYSKTTSYELKVQAYDGFVGADRQSHIAHATVKVAVEEDKTIPKPSMFSVYKNVANIEENSPSSTTVQDLTVLRNPGSFTCTFGFDATPLIMTTFQIETRTSSCFVRTATTLKWSKKHPSYKFTVRAINKVDSMQYSTAELLVRVLDKNDHTPEFTQGSYARSLPVSSQIGTSVLTVAATDADDGSVPAISYALAVTADSNRYEYRRSSSNCLGVQIPIYCRNHVLTRSTL